MSVPVSQMWTVASYVVRQKVAGRKRYPLVLMLEPLFRCNLACAGCGKIQYPAHILKRHLTPEECFKAVDECGAPMVSIPGGEPLMHPEIDKIVEGLVDLGMHERIAPRNRNHGSAALVHSLEAFLRCKLPLENVGGILDLATTGAGQVAAEQWLEHQDQRIAFSPGNLLPDHIAGHRPHLRNRNTHRDPSMLSSLFGNFGYDSRCFCPEGTGEGLGLRVPPSRLF